LIMYNKKDEKIMIFNIYCNMFLKSINFIINKCIVLKNVLK